MAQQVVIAGALFNDVPSISVPDSNNVWHPFLDTTIASNAAAASDIAQGKLAYVNGSLVTGTNQGGGGGDPWSWIGKNPTKLQTFDSGKVYFKDTALATWTWTTSQTQIKASESYGTTTSADCTSYDYVQLVRLHTHFEYSSSTTTSAILDYASIGKNSVYAYYRNSTGYESETLNGVRSEKDTLLSGMRYYSSNSELRITFGTTYGVYYTETASPTFSSGNVTNPTITWCSPTIYMRGSNSYLSSGSFSNVNMNNSYYKLLTEIWRVDSGTSDRAAFSNEVVGMLRNGL